MGRGSATVGTQSLGQAEARWCGGGASRGVSAVAFPGCGQGAGEKSCCGWGVWAESGEQSQGKGQSYREGRNWSDLLPWVVLGICF